MKAITNPVWLPPFSVCMMFLFSLIPCISASSFTQVVQLILSSTTFQNFPCISDLLSDVCKFQHHTKLCSKCSIFISFFLKFKSSLVVKSLLLVECYCCCHPEFNFVRIYCITYHATHIVKIFHNFQLFFIYYNVYHYKKNNCTRKSVDLIYRCRKCVKRNFMIPVDHIVLFSEIS